MEFVLLLSLAVDLIIAVFMLSATVYLSKKDKEIENELERIREQFEIIIASNRNSFNDKLWR